MLVRVSNPYGTQSNYFSLKNNFNSLVDSFFGDSVKPQSNSHKILRSTILDKQDHLLMLVEAPGFSKENIKVTINNNVITVSAFRKPEPLTEESKLVRSERVYGKFERSFQLPSAINQSKVEADYVNGILKISLPKEEKAKPKEIVIK